MNSRIMLLAVFILCLLMVTCGDDNPSGPDPDTNPPDNPNLVTEEIGSDGGSISSSDNKMTLTIPEGALSATETITIEAIDEEDLGDEFDEIAEEIGIENAWELGPDGLEFDVPVAIQYQSEQTPTVTDDTLGIISEFLFTSDEGTIEALDSLQTTFNADNGLVRISGQTDHFTPLVRVQVNNGVSFFINNVPEMLEVEDEFVAEAIITGSDTGPLGELVTVIGPAEYRDRSSAPIEPTFNPTTAEIPPTPNLPDSFEGSFGYTCANTGLGVYGSEPSVRVLFDLESGPVEAVTNAHFFTTIECVEAMPEMFTLNLQKEGDGQGTVISDPSGIDCGVDCESDTGEFEEGVGAILAATAADGSEFQGWSGDIGDAALEDTVITIIMDTDRTVTATFVQAEESAVSISSATVDPINNLQAEANWTITKNSDGSSDDIEVRVKWGDGTVTTHEAGQPDPENPNKFTGNAIHEYEYPGDYMTNLAANYLEKLVDELNLPFLTNAPPEIIDIEANFTDKYAVNLYFIGIWFGPPDNTKATFDADGDGENMEEVPFFKEDLFNPDPIPSGRWRAESDFEEEFKSGNEVQSDFEVTNTVSGQSNQASTTTSAVTLQVEIEGEGRVKGGKLEAIGPDETIDCLGDCSEKFNIVTTALFGIVAADVARLEAEPADGWKFDGWEGDIDNDDSGETVCNPESPTCDLVMVRNRTVTAIFKKKPTVQSCTEQPLEPGTQFKWGGRVREQDNEGSNNVQAKVEIDGVAEFVPGTQDADRGTWTTFTPNEGILDIGTTSGGEEIDFWFDIKPNGAGKATWIFTASDEGGVRGTVVCDFVFE